MMPREVAVVPKAQAIDRRVWPLMALVGLLAVLVMKEVSLPSSVVAAFGGLGLLGLFMMGLQAPQLPLYVLVVYLPFSRELVGDFGTEATAFNLTNLLMGWALIGHVANRLAKREPLFPAAPLNALVWLFCALGAASLLRAGWLYGSWYLGEFVIPLKRWLTPVSLYFLTLWIVREKRALKTVTVLIMVAVTVVGAMATWDYMQVNPNASLERSRIGAIVENPNTLGAFFNYYMFLLLGFFLVYARKPRAWLLLGPFLICFRGIMVTFSRGAYLAFAAGSLAACWFRNKLLFVLAIGGLVFAVMNPWLLPAGIRYRIGMTVVQAPLGYEQPVTETLEASAANRLIIWGGALQMIRDHPWWGVGYGAFPHFIDQYTHGRMVQKDAHNSYLLMAAEMGVPTLLLFLLILLVVAHYTRWLYRHTTDQFVQAMALGFLAGLAGLVVSNLFGSRMDEQAVASYFWILCGLIMRAVLIERQERSREPKRRLA